MPDPVNFTSATARYALPFLFAGQAQKEFFVNEAHVITDLLLHPAIQSQENTPPLEPEDGECWLVGNAPTGDWIGRAEELASWQAGSWKFVSPRDGLSVLDRSTGQRFYYANGWQTADTVAQPAGGPTVDTEARAAIASLIAALITAGVLPSS